MCYDATKAGGSLASGLSTSQALLPPSCAWVPRWHRTRQLEPQIAEACRPVPGVWAASRCLLRCCAPTSTTLIGRFGCRHGGWAIAARPHPVFVAQFSLLSPPFFSFGPAVGQFSIPAMSPYLFLPSLSSTSGCLLGFGAALSLLAASITTTHEQPMCPAADPRRIAVWTAFSVPCFVFHRPLTLQPISVCHVPPSLSSVNVPILLQE